MFVGMLHVCVCQKGAEWLAVLVCTFSFVELTFLLLFVLDVVVVAAALVVLLLLALLLLPLAPEAEVPWVVLCHTGAVSLLTLRCVVVVVVSVVGS